MSDQSKTFGCGTYLPGFGEPPVVIPDGDVDEPGDGGGGGDTTPISDDWEDDDPIIIDDGGGGQPPTPGPPTPVDPDPPDGGGGVGGGAGAGPGPLDPKPRGGAGGGAPGAPGAGAPVLIDGGGGAGATGAPTDPRKSLGSGLQRSSTLQRRGIVGAVREAGSVVLDDLKAYVLDKAPAGILDNDIAVGRDRQPITGFVKNTRGNKNIFADEIDAKIFYMLKNNNSTTDWNATVIQKITTTNVISSLNPEFLSTLRSIKKIDGSNISDSEIRTIVLGRVIRGTINNLSVSHFKRLAEKTKKRNVTNIVESDSKTVNLVAALSLLEQNLIPLDPNAYDSPRAREVMRNWRVFSTDVNRYLPITVSGVEKKYFINDSDRLMERSTLSLQDGEFFVCKRGAVDYKIFTKSEKDHGYIVEEKIRQRAIKLLGGTGVRSLSVSGNLSDNIEFTHSLTNPRRSSYVLKVVPETIESTPVNTMLKRTSVRYELMDNLTTSGIREINEFIRYKVNHRSILISDDDLLLDYIENLGFTYLEQEDILFDNAKTNKSIPLLVKQIPWYIVVVPTNKEELTTFGIRSKISSITGDGALTRTLTTVPAIDPDYSSSKVSKFITMRTAWPELPDILGDEANVQTRVAQYNPNAPIYSTLYRSAGRDISASEYTPRRTKSPIRIVKEVLREINANYVLEVDGLGTGINAFDLVSRMTMTEYNRLMTMECVGDFIRLVKDGIIENVKVYPAIRNSGEASRRKTRLFKRRATAQTDIYRSLKSKNNGGFVVPPTTQERSSRIISSIPLEDKTLAASARGGGLIVS